MSTRSTPTAPRSPDSGPPGSVSRCPTSTWSTGTSPDGPRVPRPGGPGGGCVPLPGTASPGGEQDLPDVLLPVQVAVRLGGLAQGERPGDRDLDGPAADEVHGRAELVGRRDP